MKTFLRVVTLFCFAFLGLVSCASIETTISPIDNDNIEEGITEEVIVDYNSDSAFNDVNSDSTYEDSDDDDDDNTEEAPSTEEIVSSSSTSSTTTTTISTTTTTTTTTTVKVDRSPKILKEPSRLQAFNPGAFLSAMLSSVPTLLWLN